MAPRNGERALDAGERELVEKSGHPQLQAMPDKELHALVKLMRERRDRAKTVANQQRRTMRGKATPRGDAPPEGNEGSREKVSVLSAAMRRLNSESERRRRMSNRSGMVANANKALAMKRASESDGQGEGFNSRTAHKGMHPIRNPRNETVVDPRER